jgi:hypothetical protein
MRSFTPFGGNFSTEHCEEAFYSSRECAKKTTRIHGYKNHKSGWYVCGLPFIEDPPPKKTSTLTPDKLNYNRKETFVKNFSKKSQAHKKSPASEEGDEKFSFRLINYSTRSFTPSALNQSYITTNGS